MHPVRLTSTDDLRRNRWTVFFRLILAIPHLIWLVLWSLVVLVLVFVQWWITLFRGLPNAWIHGFTCRFIRYSIHLGAYLRLASNPYPPFSGEPGVYPVDILLPEVAAQGRVRTGFRIILAIPALIIGSVLGQGSSMSVSGGGGKYGYSSSGAADVAAFLGWWACMFTGAMPRGLRNLNLFALSYGAQASAYVLLVTDAYPNSDPLDVAAIAERHDHPVAIECADDLARSRVTVFFRGLMALPHILLLALWGYAVELGVVANWFLTLFSGTPARELHRFTTSYLRYQAQVLAYSTLLVQPFPKFGGGDDYPIALHLPEPRVQNRWKTGFRIVLVVPAFALAAVLSVVLFAVAFLGWFAALATGRMPAGLRNLGLYALRYSVQVYAYLFLVTDVYPYSGPAVEGGGATAPQPAPGPETADALSSELGIAPERPLGI